MLPKSICNEPHWRLGFLLGVFVIYRVFGSVSYADVFDKAAKMHTGDSALVLITIMLFIGATGKSAQIPLFTWLPDAMAGPTPVSALIHAATMVTAGIYMIARSNILFTMSPVTMHIIAIIGITTAAFASTNSTNPNRYQKGYWLTQRYRNWVICFWA